MQAVIEATWSSIIADVERLTVFGSNAEVALSDTQYLCKIISSFRNVAVGKSIELSLDTPSNQTTTNFLSLRPGHE